jgi:hypothetical protein
MKVPANGIAVLRAECTLAVPAVLPPIDRRSGSVVDKSFGILWIFDGRGICSGPSFHSHS